MTKRYLPFMRSERPEDAWLRLPMPALRIVSNELLDAAQRARRARESQYAAGGRDHRPSHYLLSGLARYPVSRGGASQRSAGSS